LGCSRSRDGAVGRCPTHDPLDEPGGDGSGASRTGDQATIKATYRFCASAAIDPAAIIAAHRDATVGRCADSPVILAVQDTTELTFTHHPATQGLGHLRAAQQQGFLVHSVLALSAAGVPLGLLEQQAWARDPATRTARDRRKRDTREKESERWLAAERTTLAALPAATTVLTIGDREADIFDLLAAERRADAYLLIRAAHPRRIADDPLGKAAYIWPTLERQELAGQVTLAVSDRRDRPARSATLEVRHQVVEIQPPHHHRKRAQCQPVAVHAILATEPTPPPDQEPIRWRLLTTWPIETGADATAMIEVYSFRWLIERYYFILKSGCRVEQLQLDRVERLERAVATYSIVATRLLRLTYLARREPEAAVGDDLTETEWAVLIARYPALLQTPTIHAAVRAIARLGGFQGRTGDGEPGVVTLWRGFHRLHDLALGWELHQAFTGLSPPLTSYG
jgi:hypothetical protein